MPLRKFSKLAGRFSGSPRISFGSVVSPSAAGVSEPSCRIRPRLTREARFLVRGDSLTSLPTTRCCRLFRMPGTTKHSLHHCAPRYFGRQLGIFNAFPALENARLSRWNRHRQMCLTGPLQTVTLIRLRKLDSVFCLLSQRTREH